MLTPDEKAIMVAYVLGKAMLENVKVVMHEFKVSGDPVKRTLYKKKQADYIALHRHFHHTFKGFTSKLNTKETNDLMESVNNMISALW